MTYTNDSLGLSFSTSLSSPSSACGGLPCNENNISCENCTTVTANSIERLSTTPTIEELIITVADRYEISPEILYNLAWSESRLDPNAVGDGGHARGLVQINGRYWPEIAPESAFDPEYALSFAAEKIAAGEAYLWSPCSCVKTARNFSKMTIPKIATPQDLPLSNLAMKGGIAVFNYSGLWHMAVIEDIEGETLHLIEGNYEPCLVSRRNTTRDDPHLVGFWAPQLTNSGTLSNVP